jgi:hypothetical protein
MEFDLRHDAFRPYIPESYRPITADKVLKLRRYELDHDDWVVIEDLVSVLEVKSPFVRHVCYSTFITDTFFYL